MSALKVRHVTKNSSQFLIWVEQPNYIKQAGGRYKLAAAAVEAFQAPERPWAEGLLVDRFAYKPEQGAYPGVMLYGFVNQDGRKKCPITSEEQALEFIEFLTVFAAGWLACGERIALHVWNNIYQMEEE